MKAVILDKLVGHRDGSRRKIERVELDGWTLPVGAKGLIFKGIFAVFHSFRCSKGEDSCSRDE